MNMCLALSLLLLSVAGGTGLTYAYDDDGDLIARLAAGSCIGLAAFGLIGFVISYGIGFNNVAIVAAAVIAGVPAAFARNRLRGEIRGFITNITSKGYRPSWVSAFWTLVLALLFIVFARAGFYSGGSLYTGVEGNIGDLPFHLSVIFRFVLGGNVPPEDPTYAGVRLTYPFLADFVTATFLKAGASLRAAMLLESFPLAAAFVVLLHRWSLALTRDRIAAFLTPLLVLLSGGLGWVELFPDKRKASESLLRFFWHLPRNYTITHRLLNYRWANCVTSLMVTERSLLMGLGLALIILTLWWKYIKGGDETGTAGPRSISQEPGQAGRPEAKDPTTGPPSRSPRDPRTMAAAGLIAGLLPLAHAHSFVVIMVLGGCLALLSKRRHGWFWFFGMAILVGAPQILWATRNSAVHASSFFEFTFGWEKAQDSFLWFWLKNTG
ncbi:MAG TPA: hypothetical protein VJX67_09175, partial [Blastocatellia bacterium]|nr:hypothetical protein [Blastocatellia bacterium]